MYNEKIEGLINAALADGVLTEKEKQILFKRAQEEGIDLDEFEMVLDARLVELKRVEREKAEKSAPKSEKFGDVRKCPACGAIVPAFRGVCSECGYEFSGIDANLSSKKLADELLRTSSEDKKKEIIETFPIPTTKSDLLEFITSLKPRCSNSGELFSDSYWKKYQECIEKAKVAFPHDPELASYISGLQAFSKNRKKGRFSTWVKNHKIAFGIIIYFSIGIIALLAGYAYEIYGNLSSKYIDKAIYSQQYDTEKLLKKVKAASRDRCDNIIEFLVEQDQTDLAKRIPEIGNPTDTGIETLAYAIAKEGNYESGWNIIAKYHKDSWTGKALWQKRYDYMTEVIKHLIDTKGKKSAQSYVNKECSWFDNNVDTKVHTDYSTSKVRTRLLDYIYKY